MKNREGGNGAQKPSWELNREFHDFRQLRSIRELNGPAIRAKLNHVPETLAAACLAAICASARARDGAGHGAWNGGRRYGSGAGCYYHESAGLRLDE